MGFEGNSSSVFRAMPRKCGGKEDGEGGSGTLKRGPAPSTPDAVGANKKTSTPSTSDRSTKTKTTNLNAQGTTVDAFLVHVLNTCTKIPTPCGKKTTFTSICNNYRIWIVPLGLPSQGYGRDTRHCLTKSLY